MKKIKLSVRQAEAQHNRVYTDSIDYILLVSVICLLIVGLVVLFSVTWYTDRSVLFKKQAIFVGLGLICLYISQKINFQVYKTLGLLIYLFSVFLLCIVLVPGIGIVIGGAQRWFRILSVTVSPTVIAAISLLFYLSSSLSANSQEVNKFSFRCKMYATLLIPAALILKQPNLAEAVLYVVVGTFILFLGGMRVYHLFVVGLTLLPIWYYAFISSGYRYKRLMSFVNPVQDSHASGFQIIQSLIALGSGGWGGVGFGKGIQKHFYLPDSHSTFVLPNMGEEFGFFGVSLVIILFMIFILRGFTVAYRTKDRFGKLLSAAITTSLSIQMIANISIVSGLTPTYGIPLPFMSYGGTGMIIQLFSVGVLLNVSSQSGRHKDYWSIIKSPVKDFLLYIFKKSQSINTWLEPHPLYRLVAFLALLLTIVVCIIQLLFWFILKK